jgi:hypothetical protein
VVAIETDLDDGPNRTYVRFETFEKMKAWMLDIKNEAQNMVATTDEEVDWWESLFGAVSLRSSYIWKYWLMLLMIC